MPLTVEDRLAIFELVARYNQAIDGRDAPAYAATFVPDGVFQIAGQPEIRGREKLARMVERLGPPGTKHWVNNIVTEGEGDSATMTCYLMVLSGHRVVTTGFYRNTLQRIDGAWLFVRRDYTPDPPPSDPA
jgi:uncharacterized protein (TIGR02246 family)